MRLGVLLAMLGVAAAIASPPAAAVEMKAGAGVAPKAPLNTLKDVADAIGGCWKWPPASEVQGGMELTIIVSFKRSGDILGGRLSYQTHDVPAEERNLYYGAMMEALKRCSPLPVSASLGQAIAGRPFKFRFKDNRKERKA